MEIEIKKTWADYCNDYNKLSKDRENMARKLQYKYTTNKYIPFHRMDYENIVKAAIKKEWLLGLYPCGWRPQYFVYAAPQELAKKIAEDTRVPEGFGIWEVRERHICSIKKMKRLCTLTPEQMGRFRNDVFSRAMYILDNLYKGGKE